MIQQVYKIYKTDSREAAKRRGLIDYPTDFGDTFRFSDLNLDY